MTPERLPRHDEHTIAYLCVGLCGKLDTTRPPRVEALNPAGQSGYWVGRSVGCLAGELLSDQGPGLRARPLAFLRTDRLGAALAGADAHAVVQRQDEDLAVADLPGLRRPRRVDDRLHRRLDERLVDGDLQLQLRQQADLNVGAAVHLRMPALPATAAHVAHRHQVHVAL